MPGWLGNGNISDIDLSRPPTSVGLPDGNFGILGAIVWPPYIGVCTDDPGLGSVAQHEPYDDPFYERAMISWRTQPDGSVYGSARVQVPKGVYTHIAYFCGPQKEALMGHVQFEHPIIFDRPGVIDIDPIENQQYLPRQQA